MIAQEAFHACLIMLCIDVKLILRVCMLIAFADLSKEFTNSEACYSDMAIGAPRPLLSLLVCAVAYTTLEQCFSRCLDSFQIREFVMGEGHQPQHVGIFASTKRGCLVTIRICGISESSESRLERL